MTRQSVRLVVAAVAAMLLSSCWWVGPPFYKGDPSDAGPLKPGLYATETTSEPDQSGKATTERGTARIVWRRDGSVRWGDPRKPGDRAIFVAVRRTIAGRNLWIVQNDVGERGKGEADLRIYGLMERRGDDLWLLPTIDCDATVDIVRAAGGTVSDGMTETAASNVADAEGAGNEMASDDPPEDGKRTMQTCTFGDRASLERALRAYVATDPEFPVHIRFKRIAD